MNQHFGSFDVAQELQPEPVPKMGTSMRPGMSATT
jgi:hypothetical protein